MGHLHLQIIYNLPLKSSNTENVFHHEESARQGKEIALLL